jgi:quinol monooxygenase YgiN
VRYDAVIDIEGGPETLARIGPDAFMIIEQWESRDAVQAHAASAHMVGYAERVKELLLSRVVYALCSI